MSTSTLGVGFLGLKSIPFSSDETFVSTYLICGRICQYCDISMSLRFTILLTGLQNVSVATFDKLLRRYAVRRHTSLDTNDGSFVRNALNGLTI